MVRGPHDFPYANKMIWISHPPKSPEIQFNFELIAFENERTDLHRKLRVLNSAHM